MGHRAARSLLSVGLVAAIAAFLAACEEDGGGAAGAGSVPPDWETRGLAVHTVCGPATTVRGMDVSTWQGTINWDQVATTDVRFAYIRIGDGLGGDAQFARNWGEARRVGIYRGAYHFFRPALDATEQAQHFLATVNAAGGYAADDLPPMIDVETMGGQSAATVVARIRTWIETVEAATGKRPIIYTGSYFWDDNGLGSSLSSYPVWTAHWTSASCPLVANPWSAWTIWQYTSTGSVAGISGNVDLDRFAGDMAALDAFAGGPPPTTDDHGDTLATATPATPNTYLTGTLTAGDLDIFRVTLSSAGSLGAYTRGTTDTYCTLRSSGGTALAQNDDSHGSTNCLIKSLALSSGTYYFEVRHYSSSGAGDYTVRINRPVTPGR